MASQRTPIDLNWNPEAINLENVEFGDIQGEEDGKVYKQGRWSLSDTLALIQAKRVDIDTYGPTKTQRVQMTTSSVRWKAMATDLWSKGVHRNPQQIQDKWEQLAPDFKKVHDYEKKIPSGMPSYFALSPQEKKDQPRNRFPRTSLDQVLYIAMLEWYPKSSQSVDAGDLPVDSGTISKGIYHDSYTLCLPF